MSQEKIPTFVRTLAAAYAENHRFTEATETIQRAAFLARAQHDVDLANEIERDVDLYRANSSLRDFSLIEAR